MFSGVVQNFACREGCQKGAFFGDFFVSGYFGGHFLKTYIPVQ